MPPLAMLAGLHLPFGNSALIELKGPHDGLGRAAVAKQGENDGHDPGRRPQAVEGRTLGVHEGPTTDDTVVALLLLAEPLDVPLPELPTGGTAPIVAKLVLRVYRCSPFDAVSFLPPKGCTIGPHFSSNQPCLSRFNGVVPATGMLDGICRLPKAATSGRAP